MDILEKRCEEEFDAIRKAGFFTSRVWGLGNDGEYEAHYDLWHGINCAAISQEVGDPMGGFNFYFVLHSVRDKAKLTCTFHYPFDSRQANPFYLDRLVIDDGKRSLSYKVNPQKGLVQLSRYIEPFEQELRIARKQATMATKKRWPAHIIRKALGIRHGYISRLDSIKTHRSLAKRR